MHERTDFHAGSALSKRERKRYHRQLLLFGDDGQERLKRSTVVIAGAGGLGSPIAIYLAVAGIGSIRLIDRDTVDPSNLNRQILHGDADIGRSKIQSAREKLEAINQNVRIDVRQETIDAATVDALIADADIVVDALDNYLARYLLNDAAVRHGIPLVHGAIRGFHGQATTIVPGQSACLRCIIPRPPPAEIFPVIGVTPGIIGLIQANEVLKYLLGIGNLLTNRLLLWDGRASTMEQIAIERDPACPSCGRIREREGA